MPSIGDVQNVFSRDTVSVDTPAFTTEDSGAGGGDPPPLGATPSDESQGYRSGREILESRMPPGYFPTQSAQQRPSWDSDAKFPIMEIERIKKKTKKLRKSRQGKSNNASDVFREEQYTEFNNSFTPLQRTTTSGTAGTGETSAARSARRKNAHAWSSDVSKGSQSDSLAQMLDHTEASTENDFSAGRCQSTDGPSEAAKREEKRLLRGFRQRGKPRAPEEADDSESPLNVSEQTADTNTSGEGSDDKNLTLHDLCGEATDTDDIAWRNALYLLSVQPHLAAISDEGWTPLHICCMGDSPPPSFMIRALLYCCRQAARMEDEGGRLPLHFCAASSADIETMQLLVEEYPQAICQTDEMGLTPLHLLLRNLTVELTAANTQILLGLTLPEEVEFERQKQHVLQRRGEHLDLKLEDLERMMNKKRPVTVLNRDADHEAEFEKYPSDVRISLRKLLQWKRKSKEQGESEEEAEVEFETDEGETNPAAIPSPAGMELPIHILIRRAIVDRAELQLVHSLTEDEETGNVDVEVSSMPPSVPNVAEIVRILVMAYPEGLIVRDGQGLTPVLAAMLAPENTSPSVQNALPSLEIVELLLGKRSPGYQALPSWAKNMPMHRLSSARSVNPAMIPTTGSNQLPLHVAAEELLSEYSLVASIHASYPGAIQVQDGRGRTPLHLALHNYRRIPADPRIVALLLSDQVAQTRDDSGKLPFDMLVDSAHNLPSKEPRSWSYLDASGEREMPTDTTSVYQRFFNASILDSARPGSRAEVEEFLEKLRSLPPWLRKQACSAGFVQELLVEELASPWRFFLIMLDGVLLAILLTVFRIQMKEFVDATRAGTLLSSWYTYAVYAAAAARLIFQVMSWTQSILLGQFYHLCLLNGWCWIDFVAVLLSIVTSVLLYGETDDDRLLVLGTASTAFLWLSVLGYLTRWFYGMAVFMGVLSKIACRIIWPIIACVGLFVAFSQMFYTRLQADCIEAIGVTTICTVRDAYRVVYMLARGETLVNVTGTPEMTRDAVVLVAFFLLLFILFILALAVTLVLAALHCDFEEIGLASYWEPKLAFVLSTNDFWCAGKKLRNGPSLEQRMSAKLEMVWDLMIMSLMGVEPAKQSYWHSNYQQTGIKAWPLWIVALFVVPIWVVVGFATLGLLWPPQVRRLVMRPFGRSQKQMKANMAAEQSAHQVAGMRDELMHLKAMSYERSGDVEREVRELKELLYLAMKEE